MSSRGIAPIVGVLAMLAVVTTLGGVVAAVVPAMADEPVNAQAAIDIETEQDEDDWVLAFIHTGGEPLDLEDVELVISVNGIALEHQPAIGQLNQRGFKNGPTGPFNPSTPDRWHVGERASLTFLSSNDPTIAAGDTIEAQFYLDGQLITETSTTASP